MAVFIHQNGAAVNEVAPKCVGAAWVQIVRTVSGMVSN